MNNANLNPAKLNALTLEREIEWFSRVLETVMQIYFSQDGDFGDAREITPTDLSLDLSEYARLVNQHAMGFDERLVKMNFSRGVWSKTRRLATLVDH